MLPNNEVRHLNLFMVSETCSFVNHCVRINPFPPRGSAPTIRQSKLMKGPVLAGLERTKKDRSADRLS